MSKLAKARSEASYARASRRWTGSDRGAAARRYRRAERRAARRALARADRWSDDARIIRGLGRVCDLD